MIRELILIAVMIGMGLLILAKGDKQLIHILEGKLFRLDRSTEQAALTYRKHTRPLSVFLFSLGFFSIGQSIVLLASGSSMFIIAAVASVTLLGLGVWDRLRSFRAAERELC